MNEQKRTEAVLALADGAWQDYAFPEEMSVEESGGWDYEVPFHGEAELTRSFYLAGGAQGQDSVRCFFTVRVDAEALVVCDAYAIDLKGNLFGEMSSSIAATPAP